MPLSILAVEDRKTTAARMETAIKSVMGEVDIQVAVSTRGAKRLLSQRSFDIIIIGGFLPEEDGGRTESGGGLNFLDYLNETNVECHVVFYAGSIFDVCLAAAKEVSGRPVHAYIKAWMPGKRPPWNRPNVRYANPTELAHYCRRLTRQG